MTRSVQLFILYILLAACAPTLEPQTVEATNSSVSTGADALWTAQVSGVERYAGQYQGERGEATVQDGQVLELTLSNDAFSGMARFNDESVDSPPFNLSYRGGGLLAGKVSVTFAAMNSVNTPTLYIGDAETSFVLTNGRVTGSLRFEGSNDVGQVVTVVVEDLQVPY